MNLAIAGFRHGHIFEIYNLAKNHPDVNIVASWEDNDEVRKQMAETQGVLFTHDTYDGILADKNIDAIAIGDYYGARGQLAIKALKAGKHVIVDKPLCTTLEELDEIEKLSTEKGLQVSCMFSMRYYSTVLKIKEIISEGQLGEIHAAYFAGQHPLMYSVRPSWYFEEGKHGGVINDIAIHGIDILRYVTGLSVKKVNAARCWNAYAKEALDFKDCAQFMIELTNGAGVIADVSYAVPNSLGYKWPDYWYFSIWGEKGVIKFTANSKLIEIAVDGDSETRIIECGENKDNVLTNFLKAIKGEPHILTTEEVIGASRDTLFIQKEAE